MWIVNLALRRPYTFIVLSIFILIAGVLSILSTPKDIFPSINIPVISVIFNYAGMAPKDLEEHLTTVYERVLTTTLDAAVAWARSNSFFRTRAHPRPL